MCAILFIFQFPLFTANAQIAGLNTLTLFDLSPSARTAGLGMDYLSFYSDDPTLALDNPSLLRDGMCRRGSFSLVSLFSGGMMGSLSYAHRFEHVGPMLFAFRFHNYGSFEGYDEEETATGKFTASDYAFTVGWGTWLDSNFTFGVTAKPVLSQYEQYSALAMAFDLAASYFSNDRAFAASLLARNIGAQLMTFDNTVEKLPFELSAEMSYKLKRAPFRLFLAATELQRWNLSYDDPNDPTTVLDFQNETVVRRGPFLSTVDNLFRHVLFGVELNLGRSLFARVGYSYRQMAEMRKMDFDSFNLSGFSFGLGLRTRKLEFSYARKNYHLAQAPNYFTFAYRF